MQYTFKVDIGDTSGDGHSQVSTIVFKTNKTADELTKIHDSCNEKLGFKLRDMCSEYEEREPSEKISAILKSVGIEHTDWLMPDEFFVLWMDILKHLDPTLEWDWAEDSVPTWSPGRDYMGYGLFE